MGKNWEHTSHHGYSEMEAKEEKLSNEWLKVLMAENRKVREAESDNTKVVRMTEGKDSLVKSEEPLLYPDYRGGRIAFGHLKENTFENSYFWLADENGVIVYKGTTFICDTKTNALTLGDCSKPNDCIRIALEGGGTLVVNRKNVEDLLDAIAMFSPEDRRRILEAVWVDRMAKGALRELEETEEKVIHSLN